MENPDDGDVIETENVYNANGELISIIERYKSNDGSLSICEIYPDGREISKTDWDENGRKFSEIKYTYGANGKLSEWIVLNGVGDLRFRYVVKENDHGQDELSEYDGSGRLIQVTPWDGCV